MTFGAVVRINGQDMRVTYSDGDIQGDLFAADLLRQAAKRAEGQMIGPVGGPYTETNHLSEPLSALLLIEQAFEVVDTFGELPEAPGAPEGAVI